MNSFAHAQAQLISHALQQGVPVEEIILTLEVTKVDLVTRLLAQAREQSAPAQEEPRIIVPFGQGGLS